MGHIVTTGEVLMRLSTITGERLISANTFEINYGGSEANVAASLASFGLHSRLVTKVPENEVGLAAISTFRKYGVDTSCIITGNGRLGVYFLETGTSIRASKVVYDRKDSLISKVSCDEFDYDKIFEDADALFISGITAAISENGRNYVKRIVSEAKKRNVRVYADINYRSKLWSVKEAAKVMPEIIKDADVLFASAWDLINILGIKDEADVKALYFNAAKTYGADYIITSERGNMSASHNTYAVKVYKAAENEFYSSKEYDIDHITDRVGGGDAMAAGIIYSLQKDYADAQAAAEFAAAASAIKHTIKGDFNTATVSEVSELVTSCGGGNIKR